MEAILTRYIGPTNYRGSRVVATTADTRPGTDRSDRLVLGWRDELNSEENHKRAAEALARKLGWGGEWRGGHSRVGWIFVNVHKHSMRFDVPEPDRPGAKVL